MTGPYSPKLPVRRLYPEDNHLFSPHRFGSLHLKLIDILLTISDQFCLNQILCKNNQYVTDCKIHKSVTRQMTTEFKEFQPSLLCDVVAIEINLT